MNDIMWGVTGEESHTHKAAEILTAYTKKKLYKIRRWAYEGKKD